MERTEETESKYIQQHLANERTFLAWIRTIIALLGVGFVTTTLHFELNAGVHSFAGIAIKIIGFFTFLLAVAASIFSALSYRSKRLGINREAFRSTTVFPLIISGGMIVVLILMGGYLVIVY